MTDTHLLSAPAGPKRPGIPPGEDRGGGQHRWVMPTVRYVLPAIVVLVGIVFMALGSETDLEGGAAVVSAGLSIYLVNWLFRVGAAGEREREAEDAAREYFDRHGHWPDQAPSRAGLEAAPGAGRSPSAVAPRPPASERGLPAHYGERRPGAPRPGRRR